MWCQDSAQWLREAPDIGQNHCCLGWFRLAWLLVPVDTSSLSHPGWIPIHVEKLPDLFDLLSFIILLEHSVSLSLHVYVLVLHYWDCWLVVITYFCTMLKVVRKSEISSARTVSNVYMYIHRYMNMQCVCLYSCASIFQLLLSWSCSQDLWESMLLVWTGKLPSDGLKDRCKTMGYQKKVWFRTRNSSLYLYYHSIYFAVKKEEWTGVKDVDSDQFSLHGKKVIEG